MIIHKSRAAFPLAVLMLAACGGGGGSSGPPPTYSVGGTVSGLNGSGFVLRDNGGDDLAIMSDGPFIFATRIETGRPYSVSVFAQPTGPSQTCALGNALGQVSNGNVTTITVGCATNTYTVGGSVSGLAGSGLVLRDNGGDDLSVSANGPFVFATPIASGATYSVGIASQPGSPAQTCTVTDSAGTVTDGSVVAVSVDCVTLPPPPDSISPTSVTLAAGGSQDFTATVDGQISTAVTWKVNGVVGGSAATGTISVAGRYTAPSAAGTAVVSAVSNSNSSVVGRAQIVVLAPHRIAVRTGSDGLAELYDRATGSTFIARGNNFVRLATLTDYNGGTTFYHSTFNVGLYDAVGAETALALMRARGFNAVRVFLDGCCIGTIGDPAGGLASAYLANVVDFLQRAKQHSIYVIFTQDWLPAQGGYDPPCPQYPLFDGVNLLNLCAGGVAASRLFQRDFVQGLVTRGAPLETVLAYELRNEYYYEGSSAPLSLTSGTVVAANGSTYDMSDATARQRMMDEGLVYFTDQVGGAIREVDPTALVTVGFFWPQTPNPTRIGDTRLISVYPAMATSTADFVDIHGYSIPGEISFDQLMQNYGLVGLQQSKPVVMGEFGAFQNGYALIGDAAAALQAWQIAGCAYHLRGWLLWSWDDYEQPPGLWNDQAGDGSIDSALAPAVRPDPCIP